MTELTPQLKAGRKLRELISRDFDSQEDFAFEYGCDVRTISRYVNQGIEKVGVIQELAMYFNVDFMDFFKD
ncbi:MAG: helix-turn-helix transcriptional regulator [Clostridia bacterium]|nr:helix-turn-helix transcriptional regulator [Clostridia bacterium]